MSRSACAAWNSYDEPPTCVVSITRRLDAEVGRQAEAAAAFAVVGVVERVDVGPLQAGVVERRLDRRRLDLHGGDPGGHPQRVFMDTSDRCLAVRHAEFLRFEMRADISTCLTVQQPRFPHAAAGARIDGVPDDQPAPEQPTLINSIKTYSGRLFDVQLDELEMPGGVIARREIIRHPGAVAMVPVDAYGRLVLVTQYRHAAGRRLLEIPAGTLEPGEDPRDCAIRECQEEIGMLPGHVVPMGGLFVAPGYTTEYIHLFVCTDLEESILDADEDEDLEVEPTSLEDALKLIEMGEICDAKSIVGILRYSRAL